MFGWTEEQIEYRAALRRFVDTEMFPVRHDLEHGDLSPYDVMRKYYRVFGVGDAAIDRYQRALDGAAPAERSAAETLLPIIELSRCSPGLVGAMGVSVSLTAGAILRAGTREQKERWVPDLLTFNKVGAWAITEPDSGSDAIGGMRATARPHGDGWVLNGAKTFITNGPDADTIVFICKPAKSEASTGREVLTFVLDRGMEGLYQSPKLTKMGMHSSPTGELALSDVYVERDRLLETPAKRTAGSADGGAKATFATERASLAATALGMIERCLELSVEYAANRVQFGQPIGQFQLIQHKLAHMEVARLNVENLVVRYINMVDSGQRPTLAEASAMKLYAAQTAMQVALEAVQVFGGNGYMAENQVEQLARDAKVLQIFGGTDEMQIRAIAKDLLGRVTAA